MEKYLKKISPKYYWLVAFVLTAITYTMTFSYMGMLSNGKYIIARSDLKQQYIPFIQYFCSVLKGEHDYWYSWSAGLGNGTALTFAYYTLSPFNLIYLLLGDKYVMTATALAIILKASTAAATFQIFIKNFLRKNYFETALFAMMYALCGFQVCYYFDIIWMDAFYMFPVIMLAALRLIRENKTGLLVFSYAYVFATNFYMGYIAGMSSLILFMLYYVYGFPKREKKKNIQILLLYGRSVILAAMLTAIIWLPAGIQLLSNIEPGYPDLKMSKCSPIAIFNNMFMGQMQTLHGVTPFVYSGLLSLVLISYRLIEWRKSKRKTKFFIIGIIVFLLLFLIEPLNKFMHAFDHPEMFAHRFSYAFSFLVIVMASEQFLRVRKIKYIKLFVLYIVYGMIYGLSWIWYKVNWVKEYNANTILALLINIIFYFALYIVIREYKTKKMSLVTIRTLLTFFVMIELGINAGICMSRMEHKVMDSEENSTWETLETSTIEKIKKEQNDSDFYRILYLNPRGQNISFSYNFNAVATFTSAEHVKEWQALEKMGFYRGLHQMKGMGATPVTQMLFDIKYIVNGLTITRELHDDTVYQLYDENPDCLAIGYMVNDDIKEYKFEKSPFENQNRLLQAMIGTDVQCFTRIGMELEVEAGKYIKTEDRTYIEHDEGEEGDGVFRYYIEDQGKPIYIYLAQDRYVDAVGEASVPQIVTNAVEGEVSDIEVFDIGLVPAQIVKLGKNDEGDYEFSIILPEKLKADYYDKAFFYSFDKEEMERAYAMLKEQQMQIENIKDGYVKGNITAQQRGVLFTSIPYDKGWKIYVDGEEKKGEPLLEEAFLGIDIEQGSHEIEMFYEASGKTTGIYISGLSCVIIICIWGVKVKKTKNVHKCKNIKQKG